MARKSGTARAAEENDLELDYSERAGFLTGKAAAIADWSHRQEEKSYARLFARLYQRNWARKRRATHGERVRGAQMRWRVANRERLRATERRRRRALRLARLRSMGVTFRVVEGRPVRTYTITCHVCGARAERLQPNAVWCSKRCSNRYHGVQRARARSRGLRDMTLTPRIRQALFEHPGLTLKELHARCAGAKYGSLATKLCEMAKRGEVVREGRRYALPRQGAGS